MFIFIYLFDHPGSYLWHAGSSIFSLAVLSRSIILLLFHIYPQTFVDQCLVAQMVKNLPAIWETWVRSLGWEDVLDEGVTTHSSILAWRIPWTEPGRLQSMESQRVRHDWAASTFSKMFNIVTTSEAYSTFSPSGTKRKVSDTHVSCVLHVHM